MSTSHTPKRICQVIKLKPEFKEEYIDIHSKVWPSVLSALERHHVYDYSIHYLEPMGLLIATFKYNGSNFEEDMKFIGEDQETQRWWRLTDRMQESLVLGAKGSGQVIPWWIAAEEVFRMEEKPFS